MNLPLFIAGRYFWAKKSTNSINIISGISGAGIFVGTAALIIILSVFNGFEKIAISMFGSFSPDLLISPIHGKVFNPDSAKFKKLESNPKIGWSIQVLEEKALLKQNQSQYIATLRGLDSAFSKTHALDSLIVDGKMILQDKALNYCVLGAGVQARLSSSVHSMEPISVFAPQKNQGNDHSLAMEDFNREEIYSAGVFSAGEDYDEHLVLVPIRFMRKLLHEPKSISAIQLYLKKDANVKEVQRGIENKLGSQYRVQDRFEQNEVLFKVLNSEKWAVYLMLTFVLAIAVFNIMGSLTMLVIEKKRDISILSSMGASQGTIQSIFLAEGMMISLIGTLLGLFIGYLFSILQIKYGFITIGESHSFAVNSYPIVIKPLDYLYVFLTVFLIAFLATYLASRQSKQDPLTLKEQLTVH